MEESIVFSEKFTLSCEDENGYINSHDYSNAKSARNQLAYLQQQDNNGMINVGIMQTRLLPLLIVYTGDKADYSAVFDRPLDN